MLPRCPAGFFPAGLLSRRKPRQCPYRHRPDDRRVVIEPADYTRILGALREHDRIIPDATRLELARKAFAHTSDYDAVISAYLGKQAALAG